MQTWVKTNNEKRNGLLNATCDAFPNGIPAVMRGGKIEPRVRWRKPKDGQDGWIKWRGYLWVFDHHYPYPGDNGIMFERETEEDLQERLAMVKARFEELKGVTVGEEELDLWRRR
jgi:hypothetical protein